MRIAEARKRTAASASGSAAAARQRAAKPIGAEAGAALAAAAESPAPSGFDERAFRVLALVAERGLEREEALPELIAANQDLGGHLQPLAGHVDLDRTPSNVGLLLAYDLAE